MNTLQQNLPVKIRAGLLMEQVIAALPQGHLFQDDMRRSMQAAGFKVLGNGCFGMAVVSGDSDIVVKIAIRADDDGYPQFIEWAAQRESKHLPKVYHTYWHSDKIFLAAIELLNPRPAIDVDSNFQDYFYDIKDWAWNHGDQAWLDRNIEGQDQQNFLDTYGELSADIKAINDRFGNEFVLDMHGGNFLVRPGSEDIVITDPICGREYGRKPLPKAEPMATQLDMFKPDVAVLGDMACVLKQDQSLLDDVLLHELNAPVQGIRRVRMRSMRIDMDKCHVVFDEIAAAEMAAVENFKHRGLTTLKGRMRIDRPIDFAALEQRVVSMMNIRAPIFDPFADVPIPPPPIHRFTMRRRI